MAPIYSDPNDFSAIKTLPPRTFDNLGNIVVVGDYLFIVEINKGIHVIDNSNPSNPQTIVFWNIPGNTQFTIDGNTLYADNSIHLLIIDISDIGDIKFIKHIPNQYIDFNIDKRPQEDYIGDFECFDQQKGILVDWEMKVLINPNCETL